jgi:putative transposase
MTEEHGLQVTRACSAARLSRAAFYRAGIDRAERDRPVIEALNEIVAIELRWGFWKCYDRLRHLGRTWNHKRVHRVYCEMRLNQLRRTKKRVLKRERIPFLIDPRPNAVWAIDYMHDTLYGGRKFRCFNVIDEADRGGLGIEIATSLPAARIVRVLEELVELYGRPGAIRCDNGPEFLSQVFTEWCGAKSIRILYIQPGKPDQNAIIERFNRSFRREVLDAHIFESLFDARDLAEDWLRRYNHIRPHDSLGSLPPAKYREKIIAEQSSLELST